MFFQRRKLLEIFRSLSHTKGLLQGTAATLKIRIKNVEEVKKVMIEQLHGMIRILNDRMDLADESRNIRGLQIEEDVGCFKIKSYHLHLRLIKFNCPSMLFFVRTG